MELVVLQPALLFAPLLALLPSLELGRNVEVEEFVLGALRVDLPTVLLDLAVVLVEQLGYLGDRLLHDATLGDQLAHAALGVSDSLSDLPHLWLEVRGDGGRAKRGDWEERVLAH